MRRKGRPKLSDAPRTAQLRTAQAAFRKQMKQAGFWSFQAYLPSALVLKIDGAKKAKESRGAYLTRVLAPIHGIRVTTVVAAERRQR